MNELHLVFFIFYFFQFISTRSFGAEISGTHSRSWYLSCQPKRTSGQLERRHRNWERDATSVTWENQSCTYRTKSVQFCVMCLFFDNRRRRRRRPHFRRRSLHWCPPRSSPLIGYTQPVITQRHLTNLYYLY